MKFNHLSHHYLFYQELPLKLEVSVEPNFISLGPFHIAIGMNDRVWIHEIGEQGDREDLVAF